MRVLITGVAGHIGSRLADWILREQPGTEVFGIDNLSCGYRENVPSGVKFFFGNAHDILCRLHDYDIIYHFAAYAAECMSPFVRGFNYENNLVQTAKLVSNLIDCKFTGRLVFASSIAVYGAGSPPFSERQQCLPHDPYGVAKHACERDIRIAHEQHGIDFCVVRPHNVYGPYQSIWQKYRNVIGLWMRAALENEPITIFGDGEQERAFSYIDDILPALWQAGFGEYASGLTINVGGATPITINQLAHEFANVVNGAIEIKYESARHEVRKAYCTTKLSEEVLGYKDVTSLRDGLSRMWDWVRYAWHEYPERRTQLVQPSQKDVETFIGMPEKWQRELGVQPSTVDG